MHLSSLSVPHLLSKARCSCLIMSVCLDGKWLAIVWPNFVTVLIQLHVCPPALKKLFRKLFRDVEMGSTFLCHKLTEFAC